MRTIYLMRQYGTARLDGEQLVVRQHGRRSSGWVFLWWIRSL